MTLVSLAYLRHVKMLISSTDPAVAAAASIRLDTLLASDMFTHRMRNSMRSYAIDLLTWITSKLTVEQLKDSSAVSTFRSLLSVALEYDPGQSAHHEYEANPYHEYAAILVHYLQDPEFQEKICTSENLDQLVVLMMDFESRLSSEEIEGVFNELAITKTDTTTPSEETTVLLLTQLVNGIAGTSATNAFANRSAFNLTTPVIECIRTFLAPPTDKSQSVASPLHKSPSTMAACVILGNLATNDEVCIAMVRNWRIHISLIQILRLSTHSALLYATAGFLRHLAFPEQNRSILGEDGLISTCQSIIAQHPHDAAVTGEIAALIGKMVSNNLPNIHLVIAGPEPTCLTTILHHSSLPASPLPSTSMKNPTIEIGRTIVCILRTLGHSSTSNLHISASLSNTPNIAAPLTRLVRQRFYPDARAEGLLGLGLLAQSKEGAEKVLEVMRQDEDHRGLLDAIEEIAAGGGAEGKGRSGKGEKGGREYQNAVVLMSALRNHVGGGEGDGMEGIEALHEKLGKMMV